MSDYKDQSFIECGQQGVVANFQTPRVPQVPHIDGVLIMLLIKIAIAILVCEVTN
jgi:hypothetical protein